MVKEKIIFAVREVSFFKRLRPYFFKILFYFIFITIIILFAQFSGYTKSFRWDAYWILLVLIVFKGYDAYKYSRNYLREINVCGINTFVIFNEFDIEKIIKIKSDDINIDVNAINSITGNYALIIFNRDAIVFTQYLVGDWSKEMMEEVKVKINALKS